MSEATQLTREQVRRIDELAVEDYAFPSIILMENAGRGAADAIAKRYTDVGGALVVCGTGNNGGDGFVVARHLANRGWTCSIIVAGPREKIGGDAETNLEIAEKMQLPIRFSESADDLKHFIESGGKGTVIVDALLGTGTKGAPRTPIAEAVEAIRSARAAAVVSLDLPTGLDCDTGQAPGDVVRANLTVTFVAPKVGFRANSAKEYLGELVVCDIGVPPALIDAVRKAE